MSINIININLEDAKYILAILNKQVDMFDKRYLPPRLKEALDKTQEIRDRLCFNIEMMEVE